MHRSMTVPTRSLDASHPVPTYAYRSDAAPRFVSSDRTFLAALHLLERYARHEHAVVLIEGESGTGKSYFAQQLHRTSLRARGSYQCVVLSTLDDNLAASDLFGHVRGAYTDARHQRSGCFSSATGGTLFLDEIGKASSSVQRKLLHAIERREIWPVGSDRPIRIDVRLVAATNVPLTELVASGGFLPDLLARLSAFRVRIPPLRERAGDIPALVDQFLEVRAAQCGYTGGTPDVDPRLLKLLQAAEWPNNLRQLDATVQRLLIHADGAPMLTVEHLGEDIVDLRAPASEPTLTPARVREAVEAAGSKTDAARLLGVTRQTVHRYLMRERGDDVPLREC
jgi:DNA-binding NtrC family response regulator